MISPLLASVATPAASSLRPHRLGVRHAQHDPLEHAWLTRPCRVEQRQLAEPRIAADEREALRALDLVHPTALDEHGRESVALVRPERDVVERVQLHPSRLPGPRRTEPLALRSRRSTQMKSDAPTVDAYVASLPDDRRAAIAAVRAVIVENLAPGFDERMRTG